jgi:ABC-type dipeptide/oligopeptide/nickel transport system permease subunit
MWWWFVVPVLYFALLVLIAYKSGKELKDDIKKGKV